MDLLPWLRHVFIPHHSNNHKAKILHPTGLTFLVLLFLIFQLSLNLFLKTTPSVLGYASSITAEKIVELTNKKRVELGLNQLNTNNILADAAKRKANDMFTQNYWAHNSPAGRDPWSFFKEVGYRYIYAGENLARDFMDSSEVVGAWMNSASHRDNIVNSHYTEIGVAVVNGTLNGSTTTLVVQLFGTPVAETLPAATGPVIIETAATSPAILLQEPINNLEIGVTEVPKIFPSFSPFWITRITVIAILGLILAVLVLDLFFVYNRKIVRISSRNVGHLIFIGALFLAAVLTTPGAI